MKELTINNQHFCVGGFKDNTGCGATIDSQCYAAVLNYYLTPINNNDCLEIAFSTFEDYPSYEPNIDQIFSTFKFTK